MKRKRNERFDIRNLIRKIEYFTEMNRLLGCGDIYKYMEDMSRREFMD